MGQISHGIRGTGSAGGRIDETPAQPMVTTVPCPVASHYVEVNVPADRAYQWWRSLTNLSSILPGIESVTPVGGSTQTTHWKARGSRGRSIEWDAHIVEDVPNARFAWASVDSTASQVSITGAVRFDDRGDRTGIEVRLLFEPPHDRGAEAGLFPDPRTQVERALESFKGVMEATANRMDEPGATGRGTAE